MNERAPHMDGPQAKRSLSAAAGDRTEAIACDRGRPPRCGKLNVAAHMYTQWAMIGWPMASRREAAHELQQPLKGAVTEDHGVEGGLVLWQPRGHALGICLI